VSSTFSSDDVQSRANHLRQIARLACSVSSELELETVLTNVTQALLALRPDLVCGIRLIDHEAGGYRLVGTGGLGLDRRVAVVPFGEGLTHVVAETRRPVLVTDNQRDARALKRHWSAGEGLTTYYGVPIEAGEQLLGVINVNVPPSAPPTEDEQATVELFAAQAAIAIRNARMYAESEARRQAAESLAEVCRSLARTLNVDAIVQRIADTARQLLKARGASVYRLTLEPQELVTIAVSGATRDGMVPGAVITGTGLAGYAVRVRESAVTPDVLTDTRVSLSAEDRAAIERAGDRAVLAVPLLVQDRVIGALSIRDVTGRIYRPEERWLAQAFADQAALAFENARLYTEVAHQTLAAEELARIARTLSESLDAVTVAERIVESVLPLLGVHSSVLRRVQPDGSLVALAAGGEARGHITRGHVIPAGVGIAGRVVVEKRPLTREVHDETGVVLTDDIRERMEASRMHVVLVVPLATRDTILGVLAVGADAGRRFSNDDVAILQALADHAVVALQNARLYEDVRGTRDFLQGIAENSADGIVTTDTHGRITSFSPGAEDLFGRRGADVLGHRIAAHYQGGFEEARAIMQRLRADQRITEYETAIRRPDGSSVPTSAAMSLLRGADGTIVGTLGVFRNITERRQTEDALRHSEDQVRQLQKLEAIGRLAGGVAHDFNNLLTIILGRAEMMLLQLPQSDPLRRDLELTHSTAQRAAALTRQLLAFSRKQMLDPKVLDPNAVVAGMASMLARLIGEDIDFAYRPGPDVGYIRADPNQLEQVIVNLVVNARDAMPGGGRITIETANVDLAEPNASERHEVVPGMYVMLGISDTGVGMDAATRARIFEPFFTTKALGKGTGLGLSTVYGIVKQSGGGISVYSEPGEGTSFKIYLPRVEAPGADPEEPQPVAAAFGDETILVVEDQDDVREFVREILTGYGYRVLDACDPTEALLIADRHPEPLHLVLADVVMPQMNGRELADQLTSRRPELKVLFMSGYAETAIVHHGRLDPGTVFIQKPFTPAVLAGKVRALLDAAR
jgi:PAS domain S-box-containing protein